MLAKKGIGWGAPKSGSSRERTDTDGRRKQQSVPGQRATAHTRRLVFSLGWMFPQRGSTATRAQGKPEEHLPSAASFHTASASLHQWFPELFEDPSTEDLGNKIQMRIFDHNWITALDRRQKLFPILCAFKPLATPNYASVKSRGTTWETKAYTEAQTPPRSAEERGQKLSALSLSGVLLARKTV